MYIFISYAGNEGLRYAKILNDILSSGGHDTFLFEENVTADDRIYSRLGNALDSCRIAAIIITESSHTSEEQKEEYNVACSLKKGKGLIKEGVDWGEFTMLISRQYVKFNDSNVEEKMKGFLQSVDRIPASEDVSLTDEGGEIE